MISNLLKAKTCRGAAMVEALVVVPVLIILFASLVYISSLYSTKQQTLRESKLNAWTIAMNACQDTQGKDSKLTEDIEPTKEAQSGDVALPSDAPPADFEGSDDETGTAQKALNTASQTHRSFVGTVSSKSDRDIKGFTAVLGGKSSKDDANKGLVKVSTTTIVTCNEKGDRKSSLVEVAKTAWGFMRDTVGGKFWK